MSVVYMGDSGMKYSEILRCVAILVFPDASMDPGALFFKMRLAFEASKLETA